MYNVTVVDPSGYSLLPALIITIKHTETKNLYTFRLFSDVFLSPAPAVTWRTTGGIFDFHVMMGPTPEMVIQQYLEVIGRPEIPPYWALGFQMGMENFGNAAELEAMVKRNRDQDIPFVSA